MIIEKTEDILISAPLFPLPPTKDGLARENCLMKRRNDTRRRPIRVRYEASDSLDAGGEMESDLTIGLRASFVLGIHVKTAPNQRQQDF